MTLHNVPYHHTDAGFNDLWRFLAEEYAADPRPDHWTFSRLENWRYANHDRDDAWFSAQVRLWRGADRLAGFSINEHGDDPYFLHARRGRPDVYAPMLDWLEAQHGSTRAELGIMALQENLGLQRILAARGYANRGPAENFRLYDVTRPRPAASLPEGYRLTTMVEVADAVAYAALERAVFRSDYLDEAWFRGKSSAPHYRPDLHVIALAPDGALAACAHGWLAAEGPMAEVDPVGTHPDHRRKGLALAATTEALNRLGAAGAELVLIASAPEPYHANHLYEALGPVGKWTANAWYRGV
jgi:ribosomal protein S18 acetylase RimI-like enzyme